jgi:hypothetical protein
MDTRLGLPTVTKGDLTCILSTFGPDIIVRSAGANSLETVGRAALIVNDREKRSDYRNIEQVMFDLHFEALLDFTRLEVD